MSHFETPSVIPVIDRNLLIEYFFCDYVTSTRDEPGYSTADNIFIYIYYIVPY
jgi:hypothetical protein